MRYYCTYFDKGYLARGLALHESLKKHESQPFTLFVICLDELTRLLLEELRLTGVVTVPLHQLEHGDSALQAARFNRGLVEYYWTLTPSVIRYLFRSLPEIGLITYLDADLYFFSSPQPIFDGLGDDSVLIHEHRFHEGLQELAVYGRFNVGLLCFRRTEEGLRVLEWWRDRCNEWCHARLEEGKYGDQLYLDSWPERFDRVHLLEHHGCGVAPWNNLNYSCASDGEQVTVDGLPLVFYHFHALQFVSPLYVLLSKIALHRLSTEIVLHCYLPYIRSLFAATESLRRILPGFSHGLYGPLSLYSAAIMVDADSVELSVAGAGNVQADIVRLDERFSLLVTPQIVPRNA